MTQTDHNPSILHTLAILALGALVALGGGLVFGLMLRWP